MFRQTTRFDCSSSSSLRLELVFRSFHSYPLISRNKILLFSGEAPFSCEICNKSFKAERSLKNHMKTHSITETTYECNTCGKAFKSIASFRDHQKDGEMCQITKKIEIDEEQCEAIVIDDLNGSTYYQIVEGQVLKPGETEGIYIIQNEIVQEVK